MFTKKDVRDWMIEHNVYGGNIEEIDNRLTHVQINHYTVKIISCNFDNDKEDDFDRHFEDVRLHIYNELPDTNEPQLNYLDILEKL